MHTYRGTEEEFNQLCRAMCDEKYLRFFADKSSVYMEGAEGKQWHHVDVVGEFIGKLNHFINPDPADFRENVFGRTDWLYVDILSQMSDDLVSSLTNMQIVAFLKTIHIKTRHCDDFFAECGKEGIIIRLLLQLKSNIVSAAEDVNSEDLV